MDTIFTSLLKFSLLLTVCRPIIEAADRCTTKEGESGLCRLVDDCPDSHHAIDLRIKPDAATGCNGSLICCVFRGISFPGAKPETPDVRKTTETPNPTSLPILATDSPIKPIDPATKADVVEDPRADSPLPYCGFRAPLGPKEPNLPAYAFETSRDRRSTRVTVSAVGGVDSSVNAWPWMALLGFASDDGILTWPCDGSLINEQWVITAAHCFSKGLPIIVRLAEHDYNSLGDGGFHEDFGVETVEVYPDFAPPSAYHDLALVKLDRPVNLTDAFFQHKPKIVPICLPWGDEIKADLCDRKVVLTGWGATEFGGELSPILQVVPLTIVDSTRCDFLYQKLDSYSLIFPNKITNENLVCAADVDRQVGDACHGDSGGPLAYNTPSGFVLAGIVAKGFGCGLQEFPGLYTPLNRVDHLLWIKEIAFS